MKILVILLLISIVPVTYVLYQLTNLNEDDQILSEIYRKQLDAILFSVNQYSNDIASNWVHKLHDDPAKTLQFGSSVSHIYLAHAHQKDTLFSRTDDASIGAEDFRKLIMDKDSLVKRLIQYQSAGYQKIENIGSFGQNGEVALLFAMDTALTNYSLGVLMIDPVQNIYQTLSPKLQMISDERFIVSVFHPKTDSLIYSTEPSHKDWRSWQSSTLWLLPDYKIGIKAKGNALEDVLNERRQDSLLILGLLMLFLLTGTWVLFKNIRREMELSQTKSEFVSNVSHELRTPLSLIRMFAETLEMGRASTEEKRQEYYAIIGKEVRRLSRIVDNILNFSQLEAGKKNYEFEEIDLVSICQDVWNTYHFQLEDSGFQYEFIHEFDHKVYADAQAVSQAVANLLDNAIKYSQEDKSVILKLYMEKKHWVIAVTDKGIGIERAYHQEIFRKFYRTPSYDVHNTKGSGLGLSIVHNIMKAHKGRIEIKSKKSEGSTFSLVFPKTEIL